MSHESRATPLGPPRILLDLAAHQLEPHEVEVAELWLQAAGQVQPPPWVRRRAERIAGRRLPLRMPSAARRFVATLRFDSLVETQYAGLRSAQTQVRRLLFQAENIEVDLEMTPGPGPDQVRLMGQVTAGGGDPRGGFLRLSSGEQEWIAPLDDTGEFQLESLAPGAYKLEVVLDDRMIEVLVLPI